MSARLTRLATGLTGAGLTLLLLVGPPGLLTTQVGPPIPMSWPDLDMLRSIATVGVTDTFVVTSLAVVVWIAWAQLAVAIVAEAIAALRRRPAIRLPLLPGTQPLAGRLVAATMLLVTVLQPRPVAAAAPLDLVVPTAVPTVLDEQTTPDDVLTPARTTVETATRTITANEWDSWWSLAETHLGDGLRWRELRDLNTGRTQRDGRTIDTQTEQVQPGWSLLVPTAAGEQAAGAGGSDDAFDETPDAASGQWEVEHGDHFWHIAKTTLEQTWGRAPTDAEIVPYWNELIDTNRDQLEPPGDPDLVHPGQRFELPTPPPDPTRDAAANDHTTEAPQAPEVAEQDEIAAPTALEEDAPDENTSAAAEADLGSEEQEELAGGSTDSWQRALTDPPPAAATETEPATEAAAVDDHPRNGWGIPAGLAPGLAASMFLAAGAAALLRRRRRVALQQRASGYRLPTLAPETRETAVRVTVAAPTDETLDDLVAVLCSVPETIEPALVVAHDEGAVSLVFDTPPDGDPPAPWIVDGNDDGEPVRWTARLGDRGERRSFGMPLLITLGKLGPSTLLANLGAIRQLTVAGPADQVRTRLRAITLEVATSRTAGPVDVTVIGDDLLGDLDQVRHIDDPAEEIAAAHVEVDEGIILDDRVPRLIVAHDGAPTVEIGQELAPLCGAISTKPSKDAWRFDVDGEDGWLHLPDGTREQVTLPDIDPTLIAEALQPHDAVDAETAPENDAASTDVQVIHVTPSPDRDERPIAEPAWCEVGLLGPFTVTKGDEPVDGLTTISRQMLAYLVTHRETSTGKVEDAVWQGQAARGGSQRVRSALGRLRGQLGDGPDGSPLIPTRKAGNDSIVLPDHLGSDLDRAFQLIEAARHDTGTVRAEVLLDALRLVRGEPFEDLPVSWAMDIQQRAIVQLQDAAATASRILRDASRHDEAEEAIRQGLLLCDPCETLYVEWARLEQARGRTDQVPRLWKRLKQRYAEDADEIMGVAASPTVETELEFTALVQDG